MIWCWENEINYFIFLYTILWCQYVHNSVFQSSQYPPPHCNTLVGGRDDLNTKPRAVGFLRVLTRLSVAIKSILHCQWSQRSSDLNEEVPMLLLAPAAVGTPAYTRGSEGLHSQSAVSRSAVAQFKYLTVEFFVHTFFMLFQTLRLFYFFHHLTALSKHWWIRNMFGSVLSTPGFSEDVPAPVCFALPHLTLILYIHSIKAWQNMSIEM